MTRHRVKLEQPPDVQLLGDAAVLRGPAALDAYRLITEGIALVRRRDGIEPNPRLLVTVATLKAAAAAGRAEVPEVRNFRETPDSTSLRGGRLVGVQEVADLLGVSDRQVRNLAGRLGGHKSRRGAPWRFDLEMVNAYRESEPR